MATFLKNLELEELSLVDVPANSMAMVSLYKRDTSNGDNMSEVIKMTDGQKEEMDKMSDAMKAKMKGYMDKGMSYDKAKAMCSSDAKKSLEEEVETLKAENEKLRKGLIDNGFVIKSDSIEKKAPVEYIEVEGEKINKADIPAPILKRLEEAEAERLETQITKKAEETLPNFDQEVAKQLVKMDLSEDILKVLKAADALFEGLTQEVGKSAAQGDMSDPESKMNSLVEKYAQEHNVTDAQAYAAVAKTKEGKALISKIYKKD